MNQDDFFLIPLVSKFCIIAASIKGGRLGGQ